MEERNFLFFKCKYCKIISELNNVIKKMVVPLALMTFITVGFKETLSSMYLLSFGLQFKI